MTPKLIVGLGNVGDDYIHTRHNLGFMVVDKLVHQLEISWHQKNRFSAFVAETRNDEQIILIAKPTTYYNLSGEAVVKLSNFYHIRPEDLLVVHDELDLPFGTIRARFGGGNAGNNGVRNIIEHLGTNFGRLRLGIACELRAHQDAADFVLAHFTREEYHKLPELTDQASQLAQSFVTNGPDVLQTSLTLF